MRTTDAAARAASSTPEPTASPPPASPRSMALAVGIVVLAAVAFVGFAVPFGNEDVYLLRLRAIQDPSFLRGDWTFAGDFNEHLVFNRLFAPLTAVLSTVALGWIGRLACWAVLAYLLVKLAGRMGVRPILAALALAAWIPCQLRLVGADWVFATFEAKPISYIFLFASLLFALRARVLPALVLCGIAFSFHPGVGLWGVPPLVGALLLQAETRRDTARWCWVAALVALPGALGVLSDLGGSQATTELNETLVTDILPAHLTPFYMGIPTFLVLVGTSAFSVMYHLRWAQPSRELRFLGIFQLLAAVPSAGGVVLYLAGAYSLMKYFPFRVFPVITGILFVFDVARIWQERRTLWSARRSYPAGAVLGGAALLVVAALIAWSAPKQAAYSAREVYRTWTADDDDLDRTLRWVADNLPAEAVVATPPGRGGVFYLSERPQVVNLIAVVWDRIPEWYERLVAELGEDALHDADILRDEDKIEEAYDQMSPADIEHLQVEYDAEYVISRTDYDYEVVHRDGEYKVYELP